MNLKCYKSAISRFDCRATLRLVPRRGRLWGRDHQAVWKTIWLPEQRLEILASFLWQGDWQGDYAKANVLGRSTAGVRHRK